MNLKGHNDQNFIDVQSVTLISNILATHKRVMPKLDYIDKWPNIDGSIEIQNEDKQIVGKFNVQVKTLSNKHNNKIKCPVSFLKYCEVNGACFLFAVDNKNDCFYWKYVDSRFLNTLTKLKVNQTSITLSLNDFSRVSKESSEYVKQWEQINQEELLNKQEFEKFKSQYEEIQKRSNPAIGLEKSEFFQIHQFLETLNNKLESEYIAVKQFFYPNTWKVGIALYDYSNSSLGYTIYPISWNVNDVQIKTVDGKLHDKFWNDGLGFMIHTTENPILNDTNNYINDILFKKIEYLIKHKLLDHYSSDILANEYLIAFIDKFRLQLGLNKQDSYKLKDIEFAINKYFPLWIDESMKFLYEVDRNGFKTRYKVDEIPIISPSDIVSEIMISEREIITQRVEKRISLKDYNYRTVHIKITELPLRIFLKFLRAVKDRKRKVITRVFKPLDYTRGNYLFNLLSLEDAKYNSDIFFSNIQNVYNEVVHANFPLISDALKLWNEFNTIYYSIDFKESYQNDSPTARFFYLNGSQQTFKQLTSNEAETLNKKIVEASQTKEFDFEYDNNSISIKNKASTSISQFDYIYKETPFLDFIYKNLEDAFKKLLK